MPTFLFIRSGRVLDTLRGADRSSLTSLVQKHIKASPGSGSSSAFAGKGNTLAGGSGSGSVSASSPSAAGAPGIPPNFAQALQSAGRENLLPLMVLAGYLFYVFFLKE